MTIDMQRPPGWWQASDGHWYPPEQLPSPVSPQPGWWQASDGRWYPPAGQPIVTYVAPSGNGIAVAALCCAITGVVLGLIPILAVPALVLGILGLVFGIVGTKRAAERHLKRGMAITGIVLGVIAVVLAIAGFVIVNNAFNNFSSSMGVLVR